jgi:hypothetical protein
MLTREEALRLAEGTVRRLQGVSPEEFVVQNEHTIETRFAWVFFYNSKKYTETHLSRNALLGGGPLIVNKYTGAIETHGSRTSLFKVLEDYDRKCATGDLGQELDLAMGGAPLNVGWLDAHRHFDRGSVPPAFLDRLWGICKLPVAVAPGCLPCSLCVPARTATIVKRGQESLLLGTAEIRVFGHGQRVFAAPDLIYHYVVDHAYLPPTEFIEAVLQGPSPESQAYRDNVLRLGLTILSPNLPDSWPKDHWLMVDYWQRQAEEERARQMKSARETPGKGNSADDKTDG